MSVWYAGAVVAGAVISSEGTKSAAKKAAKGQKAALSATQAAAELAREDVNRLFAEAQEQQTAGFSGAAEFIGQNISTQVSPFQTGNIQAQEQVARGLSAQQAAILGQQADVSGFQARSIGTPQSFNIANPLAQPEPAPVEEAPPPEIGIPTGQPFRFTGRARR